ncbi:hypothetical protein QBC32DRAFT_30355 [Pseudoneurospora amorphoporcata]|uniref:Uncharacterized protein n=1 Tax=Pseudoneurospora amorphoporcata TaxID=241081 RepID=A0AAN6SDL5_9PEZI|nr:hypothetical protein QBC32DRAFT_30355 [Pseudoneurospora amorphoporcata]
MPGHTKITWSNFPNLPSFLPWGPVILFFTLCFSVTVSQARIGPGPVWSAGSKNGENANLAPSQVGGSPDHRNKLFNPLNHPK